MFEEEPNDRPVDDNGAPGAELPNVLPVGPKEFVVLGNVPNPPGLDELNPVPPKDGID
jgi:hypothetical protein